jgi:hypothetical protein
VENPCDSALDDIVRNNHINRYISYAATAIATGNPGAVKAVDYFYASMVEAADEQRI